jgi:hypothetical protein
VVHVQELPEAVPIEYAPKPVSVPKPPPTATQDVAFEQLTAESPSGTTPTVIGSSDVQAQLPPDSVPDENAGSVPI